MPGALTVPQLIAEIDALVVDNNVKGITPAVMRQVLTDIVDSFLNTASPIPYLSLTQKDQSFSGGATIVPGSYPTGNVAVDCGNGPLQYVVNGGPFNVTAPAADGTCTLLIENNSGAGPVNFVGFARVTGDLLDAVSGDKFFATITRAHGVSFCNVIAAQPPLTLPPGAIGAWYVDQAQFVPASAGSGNQGKKVIPNAMSSVPVSTNMTINQRSFFNSPWAYWSPIGCTTVDSGVLAPDGTMQASTLTVNASQNPWCLLAGQFPTVDGGYLPPGTYTIGAWVRLRSGTGTFVLGTFFQNTLQSSPQTPNSGWQRFSYTLTTAGGAGSGNTSDIGIGGVSTGSFVLDIYDIDIYPGSVDLGSEAYGGHMQTSTGGRGSDALFAVSGGRLTIANNGGANINFPPNTLPTDSKNVTAIACTFQPVYDPLAAGIAGAIICWVSATLDDAFWVGPGIIGGWEGQGYPVPGIGIGAGSANSNNSEPQSWPSLFDNFNAGMSVIAHTWNYATATAEGWINGVKVASHVSISPSPGEGLQNLNVNSTVFHDHFSTIGLNSLVLYDRTLSDNEVIQASRYLAYRGSLTGNSVAPALWMFPVGDQMAQGLFGYMAAQNISSTKIHGMDYGYNGAVVDSTFAAVVTRVIGITPPPGDKLACVVYIGANALGTGNAAAVASDLAAQCDRLNAAGKQVVVCTLFDFYFASNQNQFNTDRAAFNAILRTWVGTHADAVADFAAVANVGPNGSHTNATYFVQTGGPQTPAADALLAPVLVTAINSLPH